MSFTITYDPDAVAHLCEDYDDAFEGVEHEKLMSLRSLLSDILRLDGAWSAVDRPGLEPIQVEASFSSDGEGSLENDGYLTISVYVASGVMLSNTGIGHLDELSRSDDTRARLNTTLGVLDAVAETANEIIERATKAL